MRNKKAIYIRSTCLLFLSLSFQVHYGQSPLSDKANEKYQNWGIEIPYTFRGNASILSLSLNPALTYRVENSKWHFGPIIGHRSWIAGRNHRYSTFEKFNVNGISFGHSYYPNSPLKAVRFSIRSDLSFYHISEEINEIIPPVPYEKHTQTISTVSITTGYQVQVHFLKRYYLVHNFGLGIGGLKHYFEYPDHPNKNFTESGVNVEVNFRVGIGLNLHSTIKRQ